MKERLRELLWQRHDGELSAAEAEWLEARLSSDPGAEEEARAVATVARILDDTEDLDPPASLRGCIDRAIDRTIDRPLARSRGSRVSSSDTGGILRGFFGERPRLRLAYLAAGLLLGVVGYSLVDATLGGRPALDERELYGALHAPAERIEEAVSVPLTEDAGRLHLSRSGPGLVVELEWKGSTAATMTVKGRGVAAVSFTRDEVTAEASTMRLVDRGDELVLEGLESGRYTLVAELTLPDRPVEIRVTAAGSELAREVVDPDELPTSSSATNFLDGSQ